MPETIQKPHKLTRRELALLSWAKVSLSKKDIKFLLKQKTSQFALKSLFVCLNHNLKIEELAKIYDVCRETIRRKRRELKLAPYRHNKTPHIKLLRHSEQYKNWSKTVRERDNWTCQKCGKRGGEMHAHHIKRFNKNPKLRFDVSNGITLCNKCHCKLHKPDKYRKTG